MNAIFDTIRYDDGITQCMLEDVDTCLHRLDDRVRALVPADIVHWTQTHYTPDWMDHFITLEPNQIEPMQAQITPGIDEVVISGPERFGKSTIPRCGMLYKMVYHRGPKLIIYEEKTKAGNINMREFHPAVLQIPELARQLDDGGKARVKSYDLENCVVDFTGAGADITSTDQRDVWADEWDTWPLTYEKKVAQMENVRKRMRLWRNRGEGSLVICSSCKGTESDSAIWQYLAAHTSFGIWHLRCLHCGAYLPSTQIDGKWDVDTNDLRGGLRWRRENHAVIEDSIRLLCPVCAHEHTEDQSAAMNQAGIYIHQFPEIERRRGFLFGGLTSTRALRWLEIAEYRMTAAADNSFETQRTLWNSFAGIAMPEGNEQTDEAQSAVYKHCIDEAPTADDIIAVIAAADTQESPWGWYWIVRGLDKNWNTHLLACGFAHTRSELETALIQTSYLGRRVNYAIIDQGGTNADDVKDMATAHTCVWQYKGSSRPSGLWSESKSTDQVKLLLCDADRLQIMLLRTIYDQTDKTNNYWYLPPLSQVPADDDPAFDYVTNIINVRNLGDSKNSHLRQNWTCKKTERRDFFDCEKMLQVILLAFRKPLERLIDTGGQPTKTKLSEIQARKRA